MSCSWMKSGILQTSCKHGSSIGFFNSAFAVIFLKTMYNKLFDSVFVISVIIKVSVSVNQGDIYFNLDYLKYRKNLIEYLFNIHPYA